MALGRSHGTASFCTYQEQRPSFVDGVFRESRLDRWSATTLQVARRKLSILFKPYEQMFVKSSLCNKLVTTLNPRQSNGVCPEQTNTAYPQPKPCSRITQSAMSKPNCGTGIKIFTSPSKKRIIIPNENTTCQINL